MLEWQWNSAAICLNMATTTTKNIFAIIQILTRKIKANAMAELFQKSYRNSNGQKQMNLLIFHTLTAI